MSWIANKNKKLLFFLLACRTFGVVGGDDFDTRGLILEDISSGMTFSAMSSAMLRHLGTKSANKSSKITKT